MSEAQRPSFIRHYEELQGDGSRVFRGTTELRSINSPFSEALGLTKLGIHHELLPPGCRTSFPHAESAEEEFVYVIEGTPDVWIDGNLFRLAPGDAVGFPAGTGIAHSFLNDSDAPVRLLVVGEPDRKENRTIYPINPELRAHRTNWWDDAPVRPLGPHDGKPRQPK